jgi:hypothetical protein
MNISIHDCKEIDYACEALILPFTENETGIYDNLHPSLAPAGSGGKLRVIAGKRGIWPKVAKSLDMLPK